MNSWPIIIAAMLARHGEKSDDPKDDYTDAFLVLAAFDRFVMWVLLIVIPPLLLADYFGLLS